MSDDHHGPSAGFTLLELLVAIVILGFIVTALTGGVRFAGRAWEAQERRIDQEGDTVAVETALRQLIAAGRDFEGDATAIRFVAPLPRALKRGGLFDVELGLRAGDLVLAWRPHFNGAAPPAAPSRSALAKGLSVLDFSYYEGSEKEPADWRPSSPDKTKTPELVRISIKQANGRQWPPLIVAPMIDGVGSAVAAH